MLFALGLGDSIVAVTHECDYPPEAAQRAHLTNSVIEDNLSAVEIDSAVRERTERGEALYELDEELLNALAPDLSPIMEREPGGRATIRYFIR